MLPTLSDAIEHLRLEDGYDDVKVQLCLDAAVEVVKDFLDRELPWTNDCESSSSDNVEPIPAPVFHGILMVCETLYDQRATSQMFGVGQIKILSPGSVEYVILHPYRRVGV